MRSVPSFLSVALLYQGSTAFTVVNQSFPSVSTPTPSSLFSSADGHQEDTTSSSRRDFFKDATTSIIAGTGAASIIFSSPNVAFSEGEEQESIAAGSASAPPKKKVLVLGGTGFVGSEVCKKLNALGVEYIATSRDGREGTLALDFSDSSINVASKVEDMAKGCTAVISCIGAIGTSNDKAVNSGTGLASNGAKAAGVEKFVYVSVAPEVRDSAGGLAFLKNYMDGKAFSEDSIKNNFSNGYTIIAPTFIYGGDKFAVNPPRVAEGYGGLVEGLLSSGLFRFLAGVSPGIIGVALEPPVKVTNVAGAAVAGALGLSQSVLDTYDEINEAAGLV